MNISTKASQGKLWSTSPLPWSKHFEPYFLPMYKKVLEQLDLTEDTLLLDAGCGSGLFSSMAIKAGAQVIGIDAAAGLLEIARKRNPQNNFLEEDLEAMPFAANSFHVVTGFNSFQYAGSFENALIEARRVLKPGGRLVMAIWDKPEMNDATHILKAIGSLVPPPPPGTPGPFALSEDGKIEQICDGIGLDMLYKTTVACPFLYHHIQDATRSFMSTGPAASAMDYRDREIVEETIIKAFRPFHICDGIYFLQNQFLVFIAEKI
ncbi:MAG TPA: class I SAM-dependent methyltransferase [Flavitalea sp.]|nr:class I SAM-dependent methyltransferase [Flavitalea sp.]